MVCARHCSIAAFQRALGIRLPVLLRLRQVSNRHRTSSRVGLKTGACVVFSLIGYPPQSFLIADHSRHAPTVSRRLTERTRYIYFSDTPALYEKQRQTFTLYREGEYILPSDAEAVVILVQLIKHPDISIEEISDRVAQEGKRIESSAIKSFLQSHDLLKKTSDTKP